MPYLIVLADSQQMALPYNQKEAKQEEKEAMAGITEHHGEEERERDYGEWSWKKGKQATRKQFKLPYKVGYNAMTYFY